MTNILERGDIFFLYRPKLDATSVHSLADVQRQVGVDSMSASEKFQRYVES
jgi:hypothetical protein